MTNEQFEIIYKLLTTIFEAVIDEHGLDRYKIINDYIGIEDLFEKWQKQQEEGSK